MTVRWGILGNANIARAAVAPAIAAAEGNVVAAVGSRSAERARALAEPYGARAYAGYDAVLADPAVDAVYIPLPNHLHCAWTLRALEAGKHVLVEKPFAMDAAEAARMAAAAETHGRHLMEAFMYRFHPRSRRIHQLASGGELGRLSRVRAAFTFPVSADATNQRLFRPEMGGGALLDVGCYGVSVARWLLGEPTAVAAIATIGPSGVDVNFSGVLHYADGAQAVIECGFGATLQQTYTVLGDRAAIECPHDAFIPFENDATFTLRGYDQPVGDVTVIPGVDEYRLMVAHFGAVVAGKAAPAYPPNESVKQMRVLDALATAARRRCTVDL